MTHDLCPMPYALLLRLHQEAHLVARDLRVEQLVLEVRDDVRLEEQRTPRSSTTSSSLSGASTA